MPRRMVVLLSRSLAIPLVSLVALGAQGCTDVRDFGGTWTGAILEEEAVRQGFEKDVTADPVVLSNVDLHGLDAILTTSDGAFRATRLTRVRKFSSDVLGSLTFDGNPIRSYLLFGRPSRESAGASAMVLVSLFNDDHVELRILRGNDLFGVFHLKRREAAPLADAASEGG